MDFYRHLFTNDGPVKAISFASVYIASMVFTFLSLLVSYSSSTYLQLFISPKYIGLTFAAAAFFAIIITLTLPRLLRNLGNVATTILLMLIIVVTLITLGIANTPIVAVISFITLMSLAPQIYFNIDIFLETLIGKEEGTTGGKRGLILALMSLASIFSPLLMGYIIGKDNNLKDVYFVAAAISIIFIAIIIVKFRRFNDPSYVSITVRDLLAGVIKHRDINTVLCTQFLLQFFYTWAVIYFPLYLATKIGFDWKTIGMITAVALSAFAIFEYPIGVIADKHLGEKEMMALGFVILAITSASIYLMATSVIGWMILMFSSRFGASLVEVTTESYFFKQVKGHNSNLISLFRLMRPLANLIGALAGSLCLSLFLLPFNLIFVVLGFIMVVGTFITLRLIDTK